jgi:uncharacterized protein (TIGR02996 family)
MKEQDLITAAREDPDYVTPFFALADWYENHGQAVRAEWMRACCRMAMTQAKSPLHMQALDLARALWPMCKPPYWIEPGPNPYLSIYCRNGMFRAMLTGKTCADISDAVSSIRSQLWLKQAFDDGWLERIEIKWDDGSLCAQMKYWPQALLEIPLCIGFAGIHPEGFYRVLSLPKLFGLEIHSVCLQLMPEAVLNIGEQKDIRFLKLGLHFFDYSNWKKLFEQVLQLQQLCYLTLEGESAGNRTSCPSGEDLVRLEYLPNLKKLEVGEACVKNSEDVARLCILRPDLRINVKPQLRASI